MNYVSVDIKMKYTNKVSSLASQDGEAQYMNIFRDERQSQWWEIWTYFVKVQSRPQ